MPLRLKDKVDTIAGLAVLLGVVTGIFGLVGAFFSFFGLQWIATGICLIAAALAFGLVANALLRD